MSNQLVSIIIPAYNAAQYITPTIDSVIEQTYQNLEIIIVNDGSTDNTSALVKSYSDPRIRYLEQENLGQCKASNLGLSVMKGDLVKFLDSDDILNTEHIGLQVRKLNHRTDAICSCEWGRFYDNKPSSAQFIPETTWKDLPSLQWITTSLEQPAEMMAAWLWLIPKQILDKAGFWHEELSLNNDFEFSCRILMAAEEVLFAKGARVFYRSGNSSLSAVKSTKAYEAAFLSTKLGCSYLLARDNSQRMRRLCANKMQQWVYQFYPLYEDLYIEIEKEVKLLGGSDVKPGGGSIFKFLCSLFGWRMSKRIQFFFYRLGYERIARYKMNRIRAQRA